MSNIKCLICPMEHIFNLNLNLDESYYCTRHNISVHLKEDKVIEMIRYDLNITNNKLIIYRAGEDEIYQGDYLSGLNKENISQSLDKLKIKLTQLKQFL